MKKRPLHGLDPMTKILLRAGEGSYGDSGPVRMLIKVKKL
jgi:hypothetical protein